ncbi:MAG: helicase, partial [Rhizobiales bacterium]|nr:helicase [Hyphomicrobiales bacterium]
YHVYVPALLKPAPRLLALQLWALKQNDAELKGLDELPQLAASGRTSLAADKAISKALYRTAGFRVCGERAVRVDILERLADAIRPALAWRPGSPGEKPAGAIDGSGFTITGTMTSLVGSSGEDFASVLRSLGYRMEKRLKPPEPEPAVVEVPAAADATATEAEPAESVVEASADQGDAPAEITEVSEISAAVEPAIETATHDDAVAGDAVAEAPADVVAEIPSAVAETAEPVAAADLVAESASDAASAEPDMIEVWRAGRPPEERRPPRQRHQRNNRLQQAGRPGRDRGGQAPAPQGETAPPAATDATAGPQTPPPAESTARPDGQNRGTDRRGAREDGDRRPRPFGKDRDKGSDHRRDRDDRGGRPSRGGRDRQDRQEWRQHMAPSRERDRRDKEPDPDSPFAKLAALKAQLEGGKDRR